MVRAPMAWWDVLYVAASALARQQLPVTGLQRQSYFILGTKVSRDQG